MEVRIGVQNVTREVVLESSQTPKDVEAAVAAAMEAEGVLALTDEKGRRVLVPVASIAYVEIGAEESRRVGFGNI